MISDKSALKTIRAARLSETPLSITQLDALVSIQLAPGCAGSQLQQDMRINSMMLQRTISTLESMGLIYAVRDTSTLKKITPLLYITERGQIHLQALHIAAA